MRIHTIADAILALAECQERNAQPPEQFEISRADWYAMLPTGIEPIELKDWTLAGVLVRLI